MMHDEFVSIKLCQMEISWNLGGETEKIEIFQSRFTFAGRSSRRYLFTWAHRINPLAPELFFLF